MRKAAGGLLLALALLLARPVAAGEWHTNDSATCSDCHTQHNSAGGEPMRTDDDPTPARMLLRRGSPLELCLSCHDGSKPNAPDVVAPISYVAESAAGSFPATDGATAMTAHHINSPTPEVPPGGTLPMVLVCTTCHDPHGNGNYRNLRPDPTLTEQPPVSIVAKQGVLANGANPAQVYVSSNVIYKSGVSAWCGKCHGTPDPDGDHPVDTPIWGSTWGSYASWVSVTLPRVPVESPTDDTIPSQDDRVSCLSCHKAHGSENYGAVIYADGVSLTSTCEECHFQ